MELRGATQKRIETNGWWVPATRYEYVCLICARLHEEGAPKIQWRSRYTGEMPLYRGLLAPSDLGAAVEGIPLFRMPLYRDLHCVAKSPAKQSGKNP